MIYQPFSNFCPHISLLSTTEIISMLKLHALSGNKRILTKFIRGFHRSCILTLNQIGFNKCISFYFMSPPCTPLDPLFLLPLSVFLWNAQELRTKHKTQQCSTSWFASAHKIRILSLFLTIHFGPSKWPQWTLGWKLEKTCISLMWHLLTGWLWKKWRKCLWFQFLPKWSKILSFSKCSWLQRSETNIR
jgi:hypothetical protein